MDPTSTEVSQPSSFEMLKREVIWKAKMEALGLLFLGILAWLIFVKATGFSWQSTIDGLFVIVVVEMSFISACFFLKEPALERAVKILLRREPKIPASEILELEPTGDLRINSINQVDKDYWIARSILAAIIPSLGKERDGETLTSKPHSYEACYAAGLVSKWAEWGRAMDLFGGAGIASTPRNRASKIMITTEEQGIQKLDSFMVERGFIRMNKVWTRK